MLIRYLTKEKFEWLLCDNGIYLGAASAQSDPNEGVYDRGVISEVLRDKIQFEIDWKKLEDINENLMHNSRANNYISSWFLGENETSEMWDKYGSDGVALISDEILLTRALPDPVGNAASFYQVIYDDSKKSSAIFNQFKYKGEKFHYENEFRLVVDMRKYSMLTGFDKEKYGEVYIGNVPSYENEKITCCISPQGKVQSHRVVKKKGDGYVVDFDLNCIIKEIRLHPNCTEKSECLIRDVMNAAKLNISIRRSELEH